MQTVDVSNSQAVIKWNCPICGEPCTRKKITKPTSWASALAMHHQYDVWANLWQCPRAFEDWHFHAESLITEGQQTVSKRVKNLIYEDLIEHLAANGIDQADFEKRLQEAYELEHQEK